MPTSKSSRWRSHFGEFIRTYGTAKLARDLQVNDSTIYHWMGGRSFPRPTTARQLIVAARSIRLKLTYRDIYQRRQISAATAEVNQ